MRRFGSPSQHRQPYVISTQSPSSSCPHGNAHAAAQKFPSKASPSSQDRSRPTVTRCARFIPHLPRVECKPSANRGRPSSRHSDPETVKGSPPILILPFPLSTGRGPPFEPSPCGSPPAPPITSLRPKLLTVSS